MIGHLRYYHKDLFYEVLFINSIDYTNFSYGFLRPYDAPLFSQFCIIPCNFQCSHRFHTFRQAWSLEYTLQDYDHVFFIRGMGLFFLHLSIDHKGSLKATVQIVNCNEAAKQFTYALKVGSGSQGVRYSAAVRVYLYKSYINFLSNLCVCGCIFLNRITIFITLYNYKVRIS